MPDIESKNPHHSTDPHSLKILIVDDIFINHVILECILHGMGHRVESARTGLAAVEALDNCGNEGLHFPNEANKGFAPNNNVDKNTKNISEALNNLLKEIGG